jgi:Spy/CpxP family protein refolding chaperone
MQWKFLRPLVTMIASMMIMVGAAYAQDDSSIIDQLGLTPAQREQIQNLRERFIQQTSSLRTDIKRLLEEEKRLKSMAKPSETELRARLKERADKEIELSLALTRFNENLENVLTPAQRKKLEQFRSQRQK